MIGTEIKYTIDNFSGIIKVDKWIRYYNDNKNIYPRSKMKCKFIKTKLKGVYIFYDKNRKPIYIGKTTNCIRQRMLYHLVHKPKFYNDYDDAFAMYKRTNYKYFSYIQTSVDLASFLEVSLIHKYNPKFNKEFNVNFEYDEEWFAYVENQKM